MKSQEREKIGVVVIHGVGDTYEGWINRYLVPNLEKWAAYKAVDAPECRPGYKKQPERRWLKRRKPLTAADYGGELLLVVEASDRHIAIALDEDLDFRNFCEVAGIHAYADLPEYRSRARRIENRDELIYQLGMIVGLESAETWLHKLHAAGVPCTVAFDPESTVYAVRDPGSTKPDGTWQAYSRTLRLEDKDAIFTELFWADLSKVGDTNVSRMSAMLQLFLESPFVLGNAFLKGCRGGIHSVITWLIHAANWVMHWPIAGLNVAIFQSVFLLIIAHQLKLDALLFPIVVGSLFISMFGGVYAFRKLIHRKVGLAYLAISGAFYAGVLLGILSIAAIYAAELSLSSPDQYLIISIRLVLIAWTVWTVICALAAILIILVAIKRALPFGRGNITIPLSRPAAALSLSLILGMMWKAALALLDFMVIMTLQSGAAKEVANCRSGMTLAEFLLVKHSSPQCALASVKSLLIYIAQINTIAIVLFLLTAMAVVGLRTALIPSRLRKSASDAFSLPRLIASPAIVAVLFASAIFNAFAILFLRFENLDFANWASNWANGTSTNSFLTGLLSIIVFIYFLRRIAEKSDGVVHIGRDLVDHQYDPSPRSFALQLQPRLAKQKLSDRFRPERYRRRQRIQRRLETLIDDVIVKQQIDRLIFVSHSQGTVIMHDYLMNHDNLLHPAHDVTTVLSSVERIDAMTLGSPLSHIYRYYFYDYDIPQQINPKNPPLIYKVHSWVNMWRIDDPIAGQVDLLAEIENVGLGTGGHTDYWREPAVCERIWQLILTPPHVEVELPEEDPSPPDEKPALEEEHDPEEQPIAAQ